MVKVFRFETNQDSRYLLALWLLEIIHVALLQRCTSNAKLCGNIHNIVYKFSPGLVRRVYRGLRQLTARIKEFLQLLDGHVIGINRQLLLIQLFCLPFLALPFKAAVVGALIFIAATGVSAVLGGAFERVILIVGVGGLSTRVIMAATLMGVVDSLVSLALGTLACTAAAGVCCLGRRI